MATTYNRRINLYINGKEVKNQISDIRKAFYKATNELARMTVGSKEYNKKLQEVAQLKGIMNQHNQTIRETSKQWNKASTAAGKKQGILSKLLGSAKGLLPAFGFGAIIAGAIKGAKALFNMYQQTAKARREVEKLTGLTGKPLADLTAEIEATAKTFNKDFSEVLTGVNNFSKTMGVSFEQALSKINDGFLTGADSSGEFLDMLKEFGPQFRAAGLSADQSIALISQQVKEGIYSDKGADTIKEGMLRLREMPKATADALNAIGLSSTEIQQQLRNGTISVFDAIRMVSNRLSELPPQSSEVGTAIADIFGGAGEDAGLEYIKMLGTAELSLEKLKDGAGKNAAAQEKLLEANTKLKKSWSELMGTGTGTFDAIKAFAIDLAAQGIGKISQAISGVRDWFIDMYNESLPVRAGIQYMISMWITGFQIVKTALQSLWQQLRLTGRLIKGIVTFDVGEIKDSFKDWGDSMKDSVEKNAKKVAETWAKAYNTTLHGKINPVKKYEEEITTKPASTKTTDIPTGATGTGATGNQEPETGRIETLEEIESIDPRIAAEENFTETLTEEIKRRKEILDNEQQAAIYRAKQDEEIQQQRRDAYLSTLDTIINVFGQESKIGKAALIAKQAFAIAETVINIAKGTGQTAASAPFPANIPLIIGFVGQVATLIGTIKGALSPTKEFSDGGFTGTGGKFEPAGIVHKGEYVVSSHELQKPSVFWAVQGIEKMRKTRIGMSAPALSGFAEGGYTNKPPGYSSTDAEMKELLKQNLAIQKKNATIQEKLLKWKPTVHTEMIKKDLLTLSNIEEKNGM